MISPVTARKSHFSRNAESTELYLKVFCSAAIFLSFVLYYTIFQYKIYVIGLSIIILTIAASVGKKIHGFKFIISLFLFEIYQAASSFWSPDYIIGIGQSAVDIIFFSFAVIPFFSDDLRRKHLAFSLLKWYAVAMLFCIFLNEYNIRSLLDEEKGAFRSTFAVGFLMIIAPLIGEVILKRSIASLVILLTTMIVGFQLESRLYSLFSIPILIAAIAICLIKDRKNLWAIYLVSIPLAGLIALTAFQFGDSAGLIESSRLGAGETQLTFGDTVFSEANSPSASSVDIERRVVTQVSIDSFHLSPILGAGYMSTSYYVGLLTHYETAAHGLPASLLGETGAIGALLFVVVCFLATKGYLLRAKLAQPDEKRWIYLELLTFVSALIVGLFHQANHDFFLYLMMGGGLAGGRLRAIATHQRQTMLPTR